MQETLATENPISGDILHMTLKDCKLPGALRKKCETTIHGRFYSNKIFTASLMQNTIWIVKITNGCYGWRKSSKCIEILIYWIHKKLQFYDLVPFWFCCNEFSRLKWFLAPISFFAPYSSWKIINKYWWFWGVARRRYVIFSKILSPSKSCANNATKRIRKAFLPCFY